MLNANGKLGSRARGWKSREKWQYIASSLSRWAGVSLKHQWRTGFPWKEYLLSCNRALQIHLRTQRSLAFAFMLCCCCLDILNNFWTRDSTLSVCTEPCRSWSWSCLHQRQSDSFPTDLSKIGYSHLNLCVMAANLIGGNVHLSCFTLRFFESWPGWLCFLTSVY